MERLYVLIILWYDINGVQYSFRRTEAARWLSSKWTLHGYSCAITPLRYFMVNLLLLCNVGLYDSCYVACLLCAHFD
jgi:hypothetical protein